MKKYRILIGSLALLASLFFVSVASADFSYRVQYGDNLFRLALRFGTTIDAIRQANPGRISNIDLIYAGDVLVIPSDTTGEPGSGGGGPYLIQYGDTLFNIARRHGTTVPAIMAANPQIRNQNLIYVGHTITIPVSISGTGPANPTTNPEVLENPVTEQVPADNIHIVRPGDGLTGIARTYGTTVDELLRLNPHITNRHLIFVGDQIRLR